MFVLYLLVTGVAAGYCLLAIWAAIGRGHWFVRACVLLAALALLVPIRAFEPLVLFGMTSVVLVAGWGLGRKLRNPRPASSNEETNPESGGYRFRLADLLLACGVAAAASWMISVLVAHGVTVTWWRAAGTAVFLASVASLAVQVVLYRGWWWRLLLLVASILVADTVDVFLLKCWLYDTEMFDFFHIPPYPQSLALIVFAMFYSLFAMLCLLFAALAVESIHAQRKPATVAAVRIVSACVAAASLVYFGWTYARMLIVPHYLAGSPDRENVLPRISELGKMIEKAQPAESEAIFSELFSLLDRPSFVAWPEIRPDERKLDTDPALRAGRQLMRGLKARRDQLVAKGKFDEAADQCLAILRLAPMLDREGIAIHRLETDAVRHYGHAWTAKDREQLSPDKAREAARLIIAIEAGREPMADTNLRDRLWHNQLSWRHVFKRIIFAELQSRDMHSPLVRTAADVADRTQCFGRLLALDLLIRAHRAEHGAWPATLQEVTPEIQNDLLIDPYSGQPFIYRPTEPEFVLYSVGEDRTDDGGKFVNIWASTSRKPGFDLDVDTMIRP